MTERDQQRLVQRRLAIIRHAEEVTGNVFPDLPVLRDHPPNPLRVAPPV